MASRMFSGGTVTLVAGLADQLIPPSVLRVEHTACSGGGRTSGPPLHKPTGIQGVRLSSRLKDVCGCRRESALAAAGGAAADSAGATAGLSPGTFVDSEGAVAGMLEITGAAGETRDDAAEACSCLGDGIDNTARTGAICPSASIASRFATDTKTYPGASSEPTVNGRAGFPSTDINAAPCPAKLAITPDRINRSAGLGPADAATGAEVPRSRANSRGREVSGTATADGAPTNSGLSAADPTCVQYQPEAATPAQTTAVASRQPFAFCSLDITKRTSYSDLRCCQRGHGIASSCPTRNQVCRSKMRGFTLIELMVVLVIIGVLAALIVPNVLDRADDARVLAARTDVNNLTQALKLYKLDNQRLPNGEQGLQALITRPTSAPVPPNWKTYLDKLPNDPWGRPYQYLNPGVKGEVDVMSLGADGQPGGEGKNADIGSWQ